MKQQYIEAQMELIEFPACDVITTSTNDTTAPTGTGWPVGGEGEQGDEWL